MLQVHLLLPHFSIMSCMSSSTRLLSCSPARVPPSHKAWWACKHPKAQLARAAGPHKRPGSAQAVTVWILLTGEVGPYTCLQGGMTRGCHETTLKYVSVIPKHEEEHRIQRKWLAAQDLAELLHLSSRFSRGKTGPANPKTAVGVSPGQGKDTSNLCVKLSALFTRALKLAASRMYLPFNQRKRYPLINGSSDCAEDNHHRRVPALC